MARPLKKPELRMDTDLRIPVTADQKATIQQAAEIAQSDMAAWARQILLNAARAEISKIKSDSSRQ
jgi:uncharacterized protein (DUF1778 family)